jgi:hypothetical protein
MNIRPVLYAAALFGLVLGVSPSATAQTNPYFPLEPGLHFSFTSDMGGSPEVYVTVTGTELLYGQEVWVTQWDDFDSTDYRFEFYSIAPDGDILFHGTRTENFAGDMVEYLPNPPFRVLDMPVSVGHSWTDLYVLDTYLNGIFQGSLTNYSFNGEIISTGSFVVTPAGSFAALEVEGIGLIDGGNTTTRTRYWFETDVGVVRRDSSVDGVPGVTTELLWSTPVTQEDQSWGSVKALFR